MADEEPTAEVQISVDFGGPRDVVTDSAADGFVDTTVTLIGADARTVRATVVAAEVVEGSLVTMRLRYPVIDGFDPVEASLPGWPPMLSVEPVGS